MKQDGATLNRFPSLTRIHVDYCKKIEASILADSAPLAEMLWSLRDRARSSKLDDSRVLSTRDFHAASKEVAYRNTEMASKNSDGKADEEIVQAITSNWTDAERAKCGV